MFVYRLIIKLIVSNVIDLFSILKSNFVISYI